MYSQRGDVTVVLLLVLAGAALFGMFKPKWADGESRRADESREASALVERAVAKSAAAERTKGASAAASLQQIGVAAADAPPSPPNDFIRREVPVALSLLPKPDLAAQLAAEQRRVAIMEGRLADAQALYTTAYADVAALTARAVRAEADRDTAFTGRRNADRALAEAAAANLALSRQRTQLIVGVAALVILFAIYRMYLVSPAALGRAATDIRAGQNPILALGHATAPWLHNHINRAARLSTPTKE